MKVGRNDLCPCGSGKKFKKCHLAAPSGGMLPRPRMPRPPALPTSLLKRAKEQFEKQRSDEEGRITKFGHVRPIMYTQGFNDQTLVADRKSVVHGQRG